MNLILFKIKHKWFNSIIYLVMLFWFGFLLYVQTDDMYPYFVLFWFILITEPYQYGLFDLTCHFGKSVAFNAFRMNTSHLDQNLKLLSLRPIEFIKINVIYTILKLIPLWILILVINIDSLEFPFIVFSLALILKSAVGPIHTMITSRLRNLFIQNKEMKNKEKRVQFFNEISEYNPYLNSKTFKRLFKAFTYGLIGFIAWLYVFAFKYAFASNSQVINIYHPLWLIILTISWIIILTYSAYIFQAERRLENELYKS